MSRKSYARVEWTVDDVVAELLGTDIKIRREDIAEVLINQEDAIVAAMTAAGWDVIHDALPPGDDDD